jgi:hypothetical protein
MSAVGVATVALAAQAVGRPDHFYEGEGFRGRVFSATGEVRNFAGRDSTIARRRRWSKAGRGKSASTNSSGQMRDSAQGKLRHAGGNGSRNSISSVRPLQRNAQNLYEAPPVMAAPTYEYRQRPNESSIRRT